jgi:hypothetical protein
MADRPAGVVVTQRTGEMSVNVAHQTVLPADRCPEQRERSIKARQWGLSCICSRPGPRRVTRCGRRGASTRPKHGVAADTSERLAQDARQTPWPIPRRRTILLSCKPSEHDGIRPRSVLSVGRWRVQHPRIRDAEDRPRSPGWPLARAGQPVRLTAASIRWRSIPTHR